MEGYGLVYRRLFESNPQLELDSRWQFVQPSRRFGVLDVDPEQTVTSLLDEFDEGTLIRSRVAIRGDDQVRRHVVEVPANHLRVMEMARRGVADLNDRADTNIVLWGEVRAIAMMHASSCFPSCEGGFGRRPSVVLQSLPPDDFQIPTVCRQLKQECSEVVVSVAGIVV